MSEGWRRRRTDDEYVLVANIAKAVWQATVEVVGLASAQHATVLTDLDLEAIGYYRFAEGTVDGVPATVSRTGYTGEDGFELYVDEAHAVRLWRRLLEVGAEHGLKPAGLGSRDSLRLELGYALYGNDLDETRNPIEGGLSWIVKFDKGDFVARDVLERVKAEGPAERLVGLRLTERAFPRAGYAVVSEGAEVGTLTSGTLSPTLGEGIALAYVPAALAKAGTELGVRIRGRDFGARVERPPFYRDGSIRR